MAEDKKDKEQFPEESKDTVYQRDKTAKEPRVQAAEEEAKKPAPKPKIKPRKVFVPKKVKAKTQKPIEHRTRHILVTSEEAAEMLRNIVEEFQEDLAKEPSEDPDKVFEDYDKTEKFFKRLAKKYSLCMSKLVGGDLDWIYKEMPVPETLTPELIEEILKTEKMSVPKPFKTKLGYHLLLVCETKISTREVEKEKDEMDPRLTQMLERDRSETREPGSDMQIPS
ncbi:MAG: hypothetical protein G3M70_01765 [Candidatus Nitronauta litoralis]|uniref:peptidylprolyl isomerase n=1 Tax=Candidatus Nitronauta litoralis TaxID=2705533 RepID=A0A7T0FYM5_9BACT|nr:MAG: hypothetical protein G3M70_01765 [Candidatus Nitronauta litoralis]